MVSIFKIVASGARKIIESLQGLGVEPGPWQVPVAVKQRPQRRS